MGVGVGTTKVIMSAANLTIDADGTLVISASVTLEIGSVRTLTNNGTLTKTGTLTETGTLIGSNEPTLSGVSIASNNLSPTITTNDNVVTLTFTSNKAIQTPVVTFLSGGKAIFDSSSLTYTNPSSNTWKASYTTHVKDVRGFVTYSIAFSDTAGNAGIAVVQGTGSVEFQRIILKKVTKIISKINISLSNDLQGETHYNGHPILGLIQFKNMENQMVRYVLLDNDPNDPFTQVYKGIVINDAVNATEKKDLYRHYAKMYDGSRDVLLYLESLLGEELVYRG
jgi:hypothetical protein